MVSISEARTLLIDALRKHNKARSEDETRQTVLALHTGLEEAFRAYLKDLGHTDVGYSEVSFPELVDLIRDTGMFEGDTSLPPLLTSLNTTRAKIAHPRGDELPSWQIANDAGKLAELVRRFWPRLFGEAYPVALVAPPPKPTAERKSPISQPMLSPHAVEPPPPPYRAAEPDLKRAEFSKLGRVVKRLWKDEAERFQKRLFLKRVVIVAILFILAKWCKNNAITTARWPEPIKYAGLALFFLALGLFLWGVLTIWKILCQLRLKGLLITLGIGYVLMIGATVLTSDSPLPFYRQAWIATQRLAVLIGRGASDAVEALLAAPEEFRFAHTGHRKPLRLPGMDPEDTSYLTPIPANYPAASRPGTKPTATPTHTPPAVEGQRATPTPESQELGAEAVVSPTPTRVSTPLVSSLALPDCPHPQARLTVPRVDQVIAIETQVEGTANIELFDYYKFEFRRDDGEVPDEWHWVESFKAPVDEGVLGIWHVSHLPNGLYTFRLTVVNRDGNYPFPPCDVQVRIAN